MELLEETKKIASSLIAWLNGKTTCPVLKQVCQIKPRQNQWSFETFGNLVGDITGQLFQQRAVSAVPTLLKKAGFLEGTMDNVKVGTRNGTWLWQDCKT